MGLLVGLPLRLFHIVFVLLRFLWPLAVLWLVRWLWCWRRGRETPAPISFFPRRTGETFDGHIRRDREDGPGNLE